MEKALKAQKNRDLNSYFSHWRNEKFPPLNNKEMTKFKTLWYILLSTYRAWCNYNSC
jgi:hypothetical protein